jgi:phospholipid/cholesterol/gamma-HCH transport system substrate-binding protein/paraquat-inducible protein B
MTDKAHYFKIGVFIVGAIVLAVAGIIVLGLGSIFERKFSVETYFDESVQGLAVGAPLRYRGVTIGSVEQIDFVANQYKELNELDQFRYGSYILVRVGIKEVFPGRPEQERPDELVRRVQDGLRVRLTSQGVTGVVYLEADYYDPNDYPPLPIAWTPKSLYVPSGRSTVTVLGTALNKIAKDLEQAQVHKVTADLDRLFVSLTTVAEEMDIKHLNAQARQTMADVQSTLHQARRILSNPNLQRIITDAAATAADLSLASKQLPATVMRLDTTVRRVDHIIAGKSQDIDEILANLRIVSADLRELMTNAKRYPSQVLLGEPPSRPKAGKR